MAISSIFQRKHRALRPIQREIYNDFREAVKEQIVHVKATDRRSGPEAKRGPYIRSGLSGRVIRRGLTGAGFSPSNNEAFVTPP